MLKKENGSKQTYYFKIGKWNILSRSEKLAVKALTHVNSNFRDLCRENRNPDYITLAICEQTSKVHAWCATWTDPVDQYMDPVLQLYVKQSARKNNLGSRIVSIACDLLHTFKKEYVIVMPWNYSSRIFFHKNVKNILAKHLIPIQSPFGTNIPGVPTYINFVKPNNAEERAEIIRNIRESS